MAGLVSAKQDRGEVEGSIAEVEADAYATAKPKTIERHRYRACPWSRPYLRSWDGALEAAPDKQVTHT